MLSYQPVIDKETIVQDLVKCYHQSSIRRLKKSKKWAAELLNSSSLSSFTGDLFANIPKFSPDVNFMLADSCFDDSEFIRAAYFLKDFKSKESRFLHYYSKYMAAEKRRLDLMVDTTPYSSSPSNDDSMPFREIRSDLHNLSAEGSISDDSYLLYVYAIVLLKLDLIQEALDVLVLSINVEPTNWSSWHQLATMIEDKVQLESLSLPRHWFKQLFLGIVYLELQLNEEALILYTSLYETFTCSYINTQIAVARHNLRNVEEAIALFESIRQEDPARLDAIDIYSNLLYVKDARSELSSLANAANDIDPFRVETCCCIANFYSLRGQHNKAATYFARALQLNPRHISAWTLMGHEYMEIKNTGAAIQCYRSAIECNKKDYRAWYGLGQAYEILKMPAYCLHYYSVAKSLRPNDSRMILAIGETLEKLDRYNDAIKCYWKAGVMGSIKLAPLYERLGHKDKAAAAYSDFIAKTKEGPEVCQAYRFLANYYFDKNEFKLAHAAAVHCQEYAETRDEGKHLLRQIVASLKCEDEESQRQFK